MEGSDHLFSGPSKLTLINVNKTWTCLFHSLTSKQKKKKRTKIGTA